METTKLQGLKIESDVPQMLCTSVATQMVDSNSEQILESLANTKEKTPMCLINELARHNKMRHQYTLVDEQGPAHSKVFDVTLKLGEEEYRASGPSIKKAQHAAAMAALADTLYEKPPDKLNKKGISSGNPCITPTVELNALAMKRGEPAVYEHIRSHHNMPQSNLNTYDYRGIVNHHQRCSQFSRYPSLFTVSLKVGSREYFGEGETRQAARHEAAKKALEELQNLPLPEKMENLSIDEEPMKSEISLVHELALKHKLAVDFEVTKESGPPHMKSFTTECHVGEYITIGEGNGKKISKKKAADAMLEKLKELPLPAVVHVKPKRNGFNKKKNRTLIKEQKGDPSYGSDINPISRLIQIQQANRQKEPLYETIDERIQKNPQRREFVISCTVGDIVSKGHGPNKRLAKRYAAESMLQLLGYSSSSPCPTKSAIKGEASSSKGQKVTFMDNIVWHVPGILCRHERYPADANKASASITATVAQELLDDGKSSTAENINSTFATSPSVSHKTSLEYLADVLGFRVQFTDFPKGVKSEFLSLVSLNTQPPQVIHGTGSSVEQSQEAAALSALQSLAKQGLNAVTSSQADQNNAVTTSESLQTATADSLANGIN